MSFQVTVLELCGDAASYIFSSKLNETPKNKREVDNFSNVSNVVLSFSQGKLYFVYTVKLKIK